MIELDLHGASADDLLRQLEMYRGFGIENTDEIRLEGGTALAMHWKHRRSTDFDLSMPKDSLHSIIRNRGDLIQSALLDMRASGAIRKVVYVRQEEAKPILGWYEPIGGAKVSLVGVDRDDGGFGFDQPSHKERVTGMPLEPIETILAGKFARILHVKNPERKLQVRDGYDMCTAHELDPKVFYAAVNGVIDEYRIPLLNVVRSIQEWPHRIINGRALLDPIDAKLARDPWGRFAGIVSDYMSGGDNDPLDHHPGLGR